MFNRFRLWLWKRHYRPGRVITRFLAPDVRRDVEVVDVSLIDAGIVSARIRTWNVLYAFGLTPPFGEVRKFAIKDLWIWSGERWRGPVAQSSEDYADFVEHQHFGRSPRFTDVCASDQPAGYRLTTYLSGDFIPGTAVAADLQRQSFSPVPVLYYFDLKRICLDCKRSFIFFAEEQKYWYENLGFDMSADCVRCVDRRKNLQNVQRQRQRYEELLHRESRSTDEHLELA